MAEDLPGGIEPTPEGGARAPHEEVEATPTSWRGLGFLRAQKHTETTTVREVVPLGSEDLDGERVPVEDGDAGRIETLADGTISIPIYAEELVLTKRVVLKERLLLRKVVRVEEQVVEDVLRFERLELDADDEVKQLVRFDVPGQQ